MVHKTVGCANCKKRKLKCDLSLPGCQRCRRIGKDCPGYPNEWDLAFRSENEVVVGKAHKKREAATKYAKVDMSSGSSRSPSPKNVSLPRYHAFRIDREGYKVLSDDVQLHAICLFFHDYIVDSCPGICDGWLDFLPDLYGRHSENPSLQGAVLAAAYANIAQRTARKDLELKATSFYHDSLETVKNNLSNPQMATSDINMTAVILLGLYECINNTTFFDFSFQHIKGLSVLADLRGSLLLHGRGPTLLQIACCQVNRRNIEFGLHPSPADTRLNKLLDLSVPANRMIMNMFNVSVFSATTHDDIRSGNPNRIWNTLVLQSFEKLERDNRQWNEDAKTAFPYQTIESTTGDHPDPELKFETPYHVYRGFWSEAMWNKHRGGVIALNQALLARFDAAKSSHVDEDLDTPDIIALRYKATQAIQTMIRDIFASIPFSFGDIPSYNTSGLPKSVAGYFLVWSLKIILICPIAYAQQRNLARAALLRIGKQFGLCYAVKSAQDYIGMVEDASQADSQTKSPFNRFSPAVLAQHF